MQTSTLPEVVPQALPPVPLPQDPFVSRGSFQKLVDRFSAGQFLRYLLVGGFNTIFGYASFVATLTVMGNVFPQRYLSFTAMAASVVSTPLNITVAYFGYKLFVFRTRGNFLVEWLRCFAVYGMGMIPGLVALGALTRLLQGQMHQHSIFLHTTLNGFERHLSGAPLRALQAVAHGKSMAGNVAGAIVIGISTIYSFVGHKKVTFKTPNPAKA